jgi:monovalent cation:H+ antiporter-2, CPA2 family
VVGGTIARKLRQPLILGYVLGGIFIGPFTPGPTVTDVHFLESLAEFGVILLMYSIGIEFSPRDLLRVKWVAVIGGTIGVFLAMAMGIGVGWLMGWSAAQGAAVGAVVSVASTMVLSRVLIDRGELQSEHGRVMIGITLAEDLIVVVLTIVLPAFGNMTGDRMLAVATSLGKGVLLIAPTIFVAAKLAPRLLNRVARWKNDELFILIAVTLGLATAALTQAAGLSLALGAFLAGMVVSGSDQAHRVLEGTRPIRDLFVAMFFVTIGTLIDPRGLWSQPGLLLAILGMILAGKFVIWSAIVRLFGYPARTAVLVGIGLTQIGEFSFVLVRVAKDANLVSQAMYNAVLMSSLLSILFNVLLFQFALARARARHEDPGQL